MPTQTIDTTRPCCGKAMTRTVQPDVVYKEQCPVCGAKLVYTRTSEMWSQPTRYTSVDKYKYLKIGKPIKRTRWTEEMWVPDNRKVYDAT